MTTIVNDKERGLLFHNGKLKKLLTAGKYRTGKNDRVEKCSVLLPFVPVNCTVETLMSAEGAKEKLTVVEVKDDEFCLCYRDGNFNQLLTAGKYALWKDGGNWSFKTVDGREPEIGDKLTRYELSKIPLTMYQSILVGDHRKARLYYDNKLVRILDSGTYYFWKGRTDVTAEIQDMREIELDINGQEILTADKVGLRINFVMTYKVTDAEKIASVSQNIGSYLYIAAQLVLREYVSKYKADEILDNRSQISNEVIEAIRARTKDAFVEIISAGIKDIILPGEISAIMNSVLAAEKRAQANVITRREEVASTRSLLNTAKLMDENDTLRRLKELEYLERICEHVGEINVNGGADLLNRLTELLTHKEK